MKLVSKNRCVDISSSEEELEEVPGIGPVELASAVVRAIDIVTVSSSDNLETQPSIVLSTASLPKTLTTDMNTTTNVELVKYNRLCKAMTVTKKFVSCNFSYTALKLDLPKLCHDPAFKDDQSTAAKI